jgi:acetyl-CoA synthetase
MDPSQSFRAARDLLIECRSDHAQARSRFAWPELSRFNWALDWVDNVAIADGRRTALRCVGADGAIEGITYAQLAATSDRIATCWHAAGVRRGDPLLLVMDNGPGIWTGFLAAMKLGAVIVPTSPQLGARDLADRLARAGARHVVCDAGTAPRLEPLLETQTRLIICPQDQAPNGWRAPTSCAVDYPRATDTDLSDPLLAFFTSGTTAAPKLVRHNHGYPVGHLTTMYWIGLQPGDVHLNIAAPGWAKHPGSGMFAAFNAEATVVVDRRRRFSAAATLDVMERLGVTTVCAPPTAWRMLIREDLSARSLKLREAVSAGEPLDAEVTARVRSELGVTVREGYGQSETTHLIGHTPGQQRRPRSMGRPMPGLDLRVAEVDGAGIGELHVVVPRAGIGVMAGVPAGECHPTRDLVRIDDDGYFTYVARADDIFKASGYRISPLEVESALREHPAIAEVAVVPSPDPVRAWVPKAYVALTPGWEPDRATAASILQHAQLSLAPYKHIRRLTFCELPKTLSGKVRRGELRRREIQLHASTAGGEGAPREWRDHEFSV